MKDAFWTVNFSSGTQSFGSGVLFTNSGKVYGGDTSFIYSGVYTNENGSINASINVKRVNGILNSVTGVDDYTLLLTSADNGNVITFNGEVKGHPNLKLQAICSIVEEI